VEWWKSVFVRPRQARYQAALRPDMKGTIDSQALSSFTATAIRRFSATRGFDGRGQSPDGFPTGYL